MKRPKPTYCKKCGKARDIYSDSCLSDECLAEYWEQEAERYEREARRCRETAAGLRAHVEKENRHE